MASVVAINRRKAGDRKDPAPAAGIRAKLENAALVLPVLRPGATTDRYENEADRAAEGALGSPESERSSNPAATAAPQSSRTGQALGPTVRGLFERRFGHDFSKVRVHTDHQAGQTARALGAHALTVGSHIAFAPGKFDPQSQQGRRLLAHELTHVAQQTCDPGQARAATLGASLSRAPLGQVQRKLIATGSTADFVSLVNQVLGVQFQVAVSSTGEVTLQNTDVQGPPTRAASGLLSVLQDVINDSGTTTIEFIHGLTSTRTSDRDVIIGSYALSRIDLDDVSAFGSPEGRGINAGTALTHEILEQNRRQAHGENVKTAHAAGLAAEARGAGAPRTPVSIRRIDAATIEVKETYSYPDGSGEEVTTLVIDGNIARISKRSLP